MGNCARRVSVRVNALIYRLKSADSYIGQNISCPRCNRVFGKNTSYYIINNHLDQCLNSISAFISDSSQRPDALKARDTYIWKRVPVKDSKTEFTWIKVAVKLSGDNLKKIERKSNEEAKAMSFEDKQVWFKLQLEKLRVSWTTGCDKILVHRDTIVEDSIQAIQSCYFHREIKVIFKEDIVQDAGGLLREWIYLLCKNIIHPKGGKSKSLFEKADSEEGVYRIKSKINVKSKDLSLLCLLGTIMAKAVFERMPINAYLDRSVTMFLLGKDCDLEDLYFIDRGVYQGLKYTRDNVIGRNDLMEQYFTVYKSKNNVHKEYELKENGRTERVEESNKHEYIQLYVRWLTRDSIKYQLQELADAFFKVIPQRLISVFTPLELEMILYGVPFIDLPEWMENTVYKGLYNKNHQVIKWFWEYVQEFSQEDLAKLLHFCTGSTRTPIEGFRSLESNRGTISLFCIESIKFTPENPYPKAHICFNRLLLPTYSDKSQLRQHLKAVISTNTDGLFGLE